MGQDLFEASKLPAIHALTRNIDEYLQRKYPDFFDSSATRPYLPLKRSKVFHDNLWGTNRFSWRELAIIDSPLLQRLRFIHQTGLAFQVYPCAHHTRFEHSLGVATVADRIFESLVENHGGKIRTIVKNLLPKDARTNEEEVTARVAQLRVELRLAALLHDTGHSLFSHSSEQVFKGLSIVDAATKELAAFLGKAKGAGESIAFAIAISHSIQGLLDRAERNLLGAAAGNEYVGRIDLRNVALMIIGRSNHPFTQFCGDIISSGFDADKLDYLFRDANAAGLPLRYDIERYFFAVELQQIELADGEGHLKRLYDEVSPSPIAPNERSGEEVQTFAKRYFEPYRLRLPAKALNTIEQIVICKLMLFSYIYHHPKVRAAEGCLIDLLNFIVEAWRKAGKSDEWILGKFLDMTDAALSEPSALLDGLDEETTKYAEEILYRLRNRLLPREVYRMGGEVTEAADRGLLIDYLTDLQDKTRGPELQEKLYLAIGEALIANKGVFATSPADACRIAGVRIDIPSAPKFDEVADVVVKGNGTTPGVHLPQLFPIEHWTDAYAHYRNYVRIYCFSEFVGAVGVAAEKAMRGCIGIESDGFYDEIRRRRE
jgi:HD superfamily phosphohydrolase